MRRLISILCGVLGIVLVSGANGASNSATPRLVLNEVDAGSMASEQYCTLVFADRSFHSEKASRKMGKDKERRIYEGVLSDSEWNALGSIIDSKDFRELNIASAVPPLVIEDASTITISIARNDKFQNMEFLDKKSRKPYDSQLRPLLKWWKSLRGERVPESTTPPNAMCSLDSGHGVFSR